MIVACAQGSVDEADAGDMTAVIADLPDAPNTAPNVMNNPDIGMPNTMTSVCIVNETSCIDPQTLGRCRPDQMGYDPMPCAQGTTCLNGACSTEPACVAGSLECLDDQTVLRCRQNGEGYIQMTCEPPLNCGEGMCTDKLPSGSGCTTDDECASGNCRCGADTDDGCPPSLGGGICTNTSCVADGCGMSGHCLASDQVPTGGADYDHCVRSCSESNSCPTGSKCVALPVRIGGGVEFRDACYFSGVKGFGEDCTTESECLSGACLTDYYSTGSCSRRCDNDGLCSEGSACVELIAGQFWCSLTCGDGSISGTQPCPLDVPVERFDVTCKILSIQGGGVMRVCAAP